MSELSFAKQFLAKLDSSPIKLSSDNVVDPRTYPAQSAYILPRLANQKRKRPLPETASSTTNTSAGGDDPSSGSNFASDASITACLQPLKPAAHSPPMTIPSQTTQTSVYDLKSAYATAHGLDASKLRLLRNKKPVPDSKSLRDVLAEIGEAGGGGSSVEFGVMLMPGAVMARDGSPASGGGNNATGGAEVAAPVVAQGTSGAEVLQREDFWSDLKGFLVQRIRDEGEGDRLAKLFRDAWRGAEK